MRKRHVSAAALIFIVACGDSLRASEPVPLMNLATDTVRVGKPVELRPAADSVVGRSDVRVVVRFRGNQEAIEPEVDAASKEKIWRFTPSGEGGYVVSTSIEPIAGAAGDRTFQYEKLYLRAAPEGPATDKASRPSASAMARFGHRLELVALVDPSCLMIGSDLPVRVKFDGVTLKNATISATCRTDEAGDGPKPAKKAPAGNEVQDSPAVTTKTIKLSTGANEVAWLPIQDAGRWTLVVEHRPVADGVRIRPGDRFVAIMEFRVPRLAADEGREEGHTGRSGD